MNKNYNKKGFSLILAMGLVLVISLLAYMILEYMVPFSKNVKGIENSSRAYYEANAAIEEALYDIDGTNKSNTLTTDAVSNSYDVVMRGRSLPPLGKGNSEYNEDMNIIRQGVPLQLEIGGDLTDLGGADIGSIDFIFDIPDISGGSATLSGGNTPIINWQLSSSTQTLNSLTGSLITADDIDGSSINVSLKRGETLDEIEFDFNVFYDNNCNDSCVLKFSIINELLLTNDTPVPYLEWKIDIPATMNKVIPLRYTIINTEGKSYGFKKSLEVKIPGKSVSEAFDFTVFQ